MNYQGKAKVERILKNDSNTLINKLDDANNQTNTLLVIAIDEYGTVILASNETPFTIRHILKKAMDKANKLIAKGNYEKQETV